MDLSSEHKILDLKNRIEASVVIWKRKMNAKDGKSSWGSAVSLEKRELFEDRAETILLIIKQRFPGLPQSALDISKIQYNQVRTAAFISNYCMPVWAHAMCVSCATEYDSCITNQESSQFVVRLKGNLCFYRLCYMNSSKCIKYPYLTLEDNGIGYICLTCNRTFTQKHIKKLKYTI